MAVAITRTELGSAELRAMAARSTDATAARRMLALALVLDGWTRTGAARAAGMDRQTLRDWVHRYNAEGPAGLSNRPHTGAPPRKLSPDQEAAVATWVREGLDPGLGIVRWRCIDLRDAIDRRFGVRLHERSVGKLLAQLNFSHVSVVRGIPSRTPERSRRIKKRMARPVRKRFLPSDLSSLRQRIRPMGMPWPRWRSARPGPHKLHGVERHFLNQGFRTPVDCQAISLPPPADISG